MNIKKIAGVVAGAALAMGLSAPASAVVLTAGDLKITINAFDSGTTGYGDTSGVKCTTRTACDAVANNAAGRVGPSEDTWGIFSVQSITRVSNGGEVLFLAGQNGEYLTGMFGGISDTYVEVSGSLTPSTLALGTGGWLNMYLNNQNYNSSYGPNGRQGETGYTGITDIGGKLALSAVFGAGALGKFPQYSYVSNFANDTVAGNGQGYLDVTGGSMAGIFDTNAQTDPNGGKHDLKLKVTYGPSKEANDAGWIADTTGDVQGELQNPPVEVPEPASLALFGLGLAGLAALRRRRA